MEEKIYIYGRERQINYKFIPTSLFRGRHSSGDLMRINFTIAYIQYSLSNLCSAKLSLVSAQEGFVSVAARRHEFITFV